jgi:DnaJ-domain-containing protein 1
MSKRSIPIILGAATAIPFGLLGGFGPTGDHSILPWLGMLAGWGTWMLVARLGISRGWWLVAHEDSSPTSAYLRVLGLSPTATRADVKHAFREQARKHHPDAGGDAARFRELVEAKERVLAEWCSGA